MITALPNPAGAAADQNAAVVARKTSLRSGLRRGVPRPQINTNSASSTRSSSQQQQQLAGHESSDDEIPVPMKLSALTKALLNDGEPATGESDHGRVRTRAQSQRASSPVQPADQEKPVKRRSVLSNSTTSNHGEEKRQTRANSVQPADRPSSPVRSQASRENSPVRKRIVRLSTQTQGAAASASASASSFKPVKRRSTSTTTSAGSAPSTLPTRKRPSSTDLPADDKANVSEIREKDVNTPGQQGRLVRIAVGSSGNRGRSAGSSAARSQGEEKDAVEEPQTAGRPQLEPYIGSVSKPGSNGSRGRNEDNPALQSSMRVKRVGKIPGSFLSGPARRGRRRQSEEDAENDGELLQSIQDLEGQNPHDLIDMLPEVHIPSSFYAPDRVASGSPVSAKHSSRPGLDRQSPSGEKMQALSRQASPDHGEIAIPHYKVPPPRPNIPSTHDQENEAPPTFKREKPTGGILMSKDGPLKPTIRHVNIDAASVRPSSPERKALGTISQNTPHRAAPAPPPKMSILDAATSTAGAATTSQAARRRNYMKVNGKCYTRIDLLGRGGCGKVYRVAADNGSMFALKRIAIEGANADMIKGFKLEIDLLKKLTSVERVITLIDYEMNEEKKTLNLLMEMGELDLYKLLAKRYTAENASFDPVFVRYYWQEMLECLAAVHAYDIVHSDLKPANFVLVQGRLKLIDFGIAGAIQTEETVNVHREAQIGTPNYMSPESLMDANAAADGGRRISINASSRPKLMKLGKPSDIWSLGCILYQMVYGQPPFGHIPQQWTRCQAIVNWSHEIEFRDKGLGDVPIPPSLIKTMKRCLQRDQHLRPTCEELLSATDPFLYPVETPEGSLPITEELLARIVQSVVTRCRERMPTEAEALSVWPQAYWGSVAKAAGLEGKR
ncbi:kinase-like protein [Xylariaceae sp. FL0255]|nr:kinase-like protein [Xylariaceae sp. FL0255]